MPSSIIMLSSISVYWIFDMVLGCENVFKFFILRIENKKNAHFTKFFNQYNVVQKHPTIYIYLWYFMFSFFRSTWIIFIFGLNSPILVFQIIKFFPDFWQSRYFIFDIFIFIFDTIILSLLLLYYLLSTYLFKMNYFIYLWFCVYVK